MVKALKCVSCGGNLVFEDSLRISVCQYCGTSNATIGEDGDRRQVSYFPVVNGGGKTQIPLLLQIARFIEVQTDFWPAPCEYTYNERESFTVNEDGKVNRIWAVNVEKGRFSICNILVKTENKKVKKSGNSAFASLFRAAQYEQAQVVTGLDVEVLARLYVLPVFDEFGDNGVLVGYRVEIYVRHESWIEEIDVVSLQIKEHFGVVPEVELSNI